MSFSSVEAGHCDYGVVPIENSSEGAVNRSLDLLVDSELTIIAQVFLRVRHCLFSQSTLKILSEVRSKDQALAQCADWLRTKLPKARLVPVSSTAEAVRECRTNEGVAAIAGEIGWAEFIEVPTIEDGYSGPIGQCHPLSSGCATNLAYAGGGFLSNKFGLLTKR